MTTGLEPEHYWIQNNMSKACTIGVIAHRLITNFVQNIEIEQGLQTMYIHNPTIRICGCFHVELPLSLENLTQRYGQ